MWHTIVSVCTSCCERLVWSWCLDEAGMIGWSQLGRRSHWNTNQSMLSKATSPPINWHSLFKMIIYLSQIPSGGARVYAHVWVGVCWENPDHFVLFVNFSAGEKGGGGGGGVWLEAWGWKNEQEFFKKIAFIKGVWFWCKQRWITSNT